MINCSDCTANCCRQVGQFPYMKDYDRGDGTCRYLDQDNRCMIYENRPPMCNTDLLYERYYSRYNECRSVRTIKKGHPVG